VYTFQYVIPSPLDPLKGRPSATLTTLSVPVSFLDTVSKVNGARVQIIGAGQTGAFADGVTIYIDEVRLQALDALPTPTPTALYIPTSTLPAARPVTATPIVGEPHNNFASATTDECATCHRSHTAKSSSLRKLTGEEQVCFACHTSGGTGTNVQPAFTSKTNTVTRFFSHGVSSSVNIHNVSEKAGGDFGVPKRHVECEDCHAPHSTARTALGGTISAPAAQQEVYDSTGVDPQWTVLGAPTSFKWMTTAEREYQICFKCHSSYAASLPTYIPDGWNGDTKAYEANGLPKLTSTLATQKRDSRDMAQEFNSYQVSFHPVAALGRNRNMPAGSFVAGWSQDSILYCGDCHDNASAPTNGNGPHGSPRLHILAGSSEYITKVDPSKSCAPGGCPSIHTPGELCFKCHQYGTYATNINPPTTTRFKKGVENLHVFHSFAACYTCHDSHGSEQDRLINFDVSVVSVGGNSQSAWNYDPATNVGSCSISCHGGDHGGDPFFEYSP
ncbi:MAG: cytochrome c3 family protein, partial [Anaerolineales bacterium]|nr:cytochrome c3 family protein [Anaerolineales bacterium]